MADNVNITVSSGDAITVTVASSAAQTMTVADASSAAQTSYDPSGSDLTAVDLQTVIDTLANEKFVQDAAPTVGVTEGDLWYDADDDILNVRRDTSWVD